MDESNERVVLDLTREQAMTVERAMEIYARLLIGQFRMLPDLMMVEFDDVNEFCRRRDDARDALELAAKLLFGRNPYDQPDVTKKSDQHQRAWSVYEVLRYTRCWHDNPEGDKWSVCYDKPMQWLHEPLPKCKIVEGDEKDGTL